MDPIPVPKRAHASSSRLPGGTTDEAQTDRNHDTVVKESGSTGRGNAEHFRRSDDSDAVPSHSHNAGDGITSWAELS